VSLQNKFFDVPLYFLYESNIVITVPNETQKNEFDTQRTVQSDIFL